MPLFQHLRTVRSNSSSLNAGAASICARISAAGRLFRDVIAAVLSTDVASISAHEKAFDVFTITSGERRTTDVEGGNASFLISRAVKAKPSCPGSWAAPTRTVMLKVTKGNLCPGASPREWLPRGGGAEEKDHGESFHDPLPSRRMTTRLAGMR